MDEKQMVFIIKLTGFFKMDWEKEDRRKALDGLAKELKNL